MTAAVPETAARRLLKQNTKGNSEPLSSSWKVYTFTSSSVMSCQDLLFSAFITFKAFVWSNINFFLHGCEKVLFVLQDKGPLHE